MSILDQQTHLDKAVVISSPRSVEAMRRTGITNDELWPKNDQQIKEHFQQFGLDKKGLQIRRGHYEERRTERLAMLVQEREKIMEQEENGKWNRDDIRSLEMSMAGPQMTNSSVHRSKIAHPMALKERASLQKIKEKQAKELQMKIEYEIKIEETQRQNQAKLEKQAERQRQQEADRQARRAEREEHMKQQQEIQRLRQEQDAIAQERKYLQQQEKDQFKKEKEAIIQQERQKQIKLRQEQQKLLAQQKALKKEQGEQEQQLRMEKRIQEMKEKEEEFEALMAEKKELQEIEADRNREYLLQKIEKVKVRNQEETAKQWQEFERKQIEDEEKRKKYEKEKAEKLAELKERGHRKQEFIKKVLLSNDQNIEQQRIDYYEKQKEIQMKLQEKEAKERQALNERKQHYSRKEIAMKEILQKNIAMEEKKKNIYQDKLIQKEDKLQEVQRKRYEQVQAKREEDFVKQQDRRENAERMSRIQQHHRDLLLLKINKENSRLQAIKDEKLELLQVRRKMQAEVQQNRKEMEEKLVLLRSGKMSAQQLLRDANILKTEESVIHREASEGGFITQQHTPSVVHSRRGASEKNLQIKTVSQGNILIIMVGRREQAQKQLDQLKVKQNEEMLKVLEEEQSKEEQREQQKEGQEGEELAQMEHAHGLERAMAQQRIMRLSKYHPLVILVNMTGRPSNYEAVCGCERVYYIYIKYHMQEGGRTEGMPNDPRPKRVKTDMMQVNSQMHFKYQGSLQLTKDINDELDQIQIRINQAQEQEEHLWIQQLATLYAQGRPDDFQAPAQLQELGKERLAWVRPAQDQRRVRQFVDPALVREASGSIEKRGEEIERILSRSRKNMNKHRREYQQGVARQEGRWGGVG